MDVLGVLSSFAILFFGYCALAVVEGRLQGRDQPNLELGMATVLAVLGAVFFAFWGWNATFVMLGIFVVWTFAGALLDRGGGPPQGE